MNYIYTYFSAKIGAIGRLLDLAKDAWDQKIWLAVILVILWTAFCTIGGILFFPIDFIWCAIMWHRNRGGREALTEIMDEMTSD